MLAIEDLRRDLEAVALADDVAPMRAYMREQFEFLGVKSRARRTAAGPMLAAAKQAAPDEVLDFAAACWREPEREFQYVAVDMLVANNRRLGIEHLPAIVDLVVDKSWWDTVDFLGPRVIGEILLPDPASWSVVDAWTEGENVWLARCAILQQLHYGERTDEAVLFDRCLRRCGDPDFFIRKAIGWALRQYARVDPDAVRAFVGDNRVRLSPLSIREATKHL